MLATRPTSQILVYDFSYSWHANLSPNSRSSIRRALAVSWTNSGSNASLIEMITL